MYRFHIARKKIPHADENGNKVTPSKENGWKMEMFIFDVFCASKKMVALEVNREEEFSPLKNGSGAPKDSPETCLADLCRLHTKYIVRAGGAVAIENKESSKAPPMVEISPLTSYFGEDIESMVKGITFTVPTELKSETTLPARE